MFRPGHHFVANPVSQTVVGHPIASAIPIEGSRIQSVAEPITSTYLIEQFVNKSVYKDLVVAGGIGLLDYLLDRNIKSAFTIFAGAFAIQFAVDKVIIG